jgi:hypothetical protein
MTRARVGIKGSTPTAKGPQRLSCGPFAVPRAGNSREQARTADREPQCFRGFSRVFPAVLGQRTYRGERLGLAFKAVFGLSAVFLRSQGGVYAIEYGRMLPRQTAGPELHNSIEAQRRTACRPASGRAH